jgi:histidinol-phosphate aminotransferase
MRPLVEPHLRELIPYVPGKPIEETEREYGITNIAKLASNENCLGPSPKAVEAMREAAAGAHLYPDADCYYLKQRICQRHAPYGIEPRHLVVGNGTNEILTNMARAFLGPGDGLLNAWPSFVVYRLAARSCGRREVSVPLDEKLGYDLAAMAKVAADPADGIKMLFLANPNNPTGSYVGQAALEDFLGRVPDDMIVVLDGAYAEYATAADYPDDLALAMRRPRTVVTRTFSKAFGLAALRVGYAVCDPEIADTLNRLRDPFNTNALGQRAALAALDDEEHVTRSREHNAAELPRLTQGLAALGLRTWPSQANFVLAAVQEGMPDMATVYAELLRLGVIVRPVQNYGLSQAARITVGTAAENDRLLTALAQVLSARAP